MPETKVRRSPFPPWIDRGRPLLAAALVLVPIYFIGLAYLAGSPQTTDVGYMPRQPVPFSHAVHAGTLGLDCRYCHTTVERAAHAAIPSTQICMNCHGQVLSGSERLALVRRSAETGVPIPWVRVHDLPDFAYFDHSAHVSRGVGCYSCHGRVDRMDEIRQVEKLSMGWCLDCHRDPAPHLAPPDRLTDLDWAVRTDQAARREIGAALMKANKIQPSTDCSTCHR